MNEITNIDVLEFLRQLCNLGNAFHLNEETMIIEKNDGQACCVQEGDQVKPVQILFNGMVRDEANALLNPFKMVEGNNPALTWFYQSRFTVVSVLVKKLIIRIVEVGYTKETEDYDQMKVLAKISENCDKTMVEELQKINASDYLRIFYNKRNKTAEAQTAIFTDMLESQHKFRKKTWKTVRELFRELFQLGDADTMAKYMYRATILSIPEIDAKLHVMGMVLKAIDPWCNTLLKTPVESEKFEKHLKNLEVYARMYAWFTAKVDSNNNAVVSNHHPGEIPVGTSDAWGNSPAIPVNAQLTASASGDSEIRVDAPSAPTPTSAMPLPGGHVPGVVGTPMPLPGGVMAGAMMPTTMVPSVSVPVPVPGVAVAPAMPMMVPGMMPAGSVPGRTYQEEFDERNRISVI